MDSFLKFSILTVPLILISCTHIEDKAIPKIRFQLWDIESKNDTCMILSYNVNSRIAEAFFSEYVGCISESGWVLCPYASSATIQLNRNNTFSVTQVQNNSSFKMVLPDTLHWHVVDEMIQLDQFELFQMPPANMLSNWD